jgi:Zn-dependent peptidase ImmA (M78 family)
MTKLEDQLNIIRKHQRRPPVLLEPIARDLGLRVYKVPGWPDNISGWIYRASPEVAGESGYAIEVNALHSPARRRFTIAHEIAHFILHPHLIGDGITDDAMYRSGLPSAVETQANRLAAQILMPDRLLSMEQGRSRTSEDLARIFNVSELAMKIRLGVLA